MHHPYRYFGEQPEQTYENIGSYIKYVHVKDSVVDRDGRLQYKMMGYGDLPVKEGVRILNENGYDGYLSLEWVKRVDIPISKRPASYFCNILII